MTQQMPGGSEAVDEKKDAANPPQALTGRRRGAAGDGRQWPQLYECAAAFDIEQKTAWNVIARRSYKDVA